MSVRVSAAGDHTVTLNGMLERICGAGASDKFELVVDGSLAENGKDVFIISSSGSRPCIKGNSVLSVATGINWYLNHTARINLTWNRLNTDLSGTYLPLPQKEEKHVCSADYRYYLNYCTFSYSMAFWSWERWEKELDWMALHGINMPLMLVGMDVVWKNILTELGYSASEIADFVAGPGFQAWWLMNNLEGWGGPNPDWWYTRQEELSRKIVARMDELGMTPVLPGYSGMVPNNINAKKGWNAADPGKWCQFRRPAFLLPTDEHFPEMAALYYKHLGELMGTSSYYSMDPFHEGGNTSDVDLKSAYTAILNEMSKVNADAKWVIQSWNENPRAECLRVVLEGRLVVLDLFSDGLPKWQRGYNGHEIVYCMLHNFGGRVGMHGRLSKTIDGYYDALLTLPRQIKGVGATPEGIETNPVLYDCLFELPWRDSCTADEWLPEYVKARYGTDGNAYAEVAWSLLERSVYGCPTAQQGTSEPVICARPALDVNSVSTWSTSRIYYDKEDVIRAAALMLKAAEELDGDNFRYDLVDIVRQAVTDHANGLLARMRVAYESDDKREFGRLKKHFLKLILDQDRLLSTTPAFMLGRCTDMARKLTDEVPGRSSADKDWLEWNARTQVTVWGNKEAADDGGLHDYSNREWGGLLKDFHYIRWKTYLDALQRGEEQPDWFDLEEAWTDDFSYVYTDAPEGDAVKVARKMFHRYFPDADVRTLF